MEEALPISVREGDACGDARETVRAEGFEILCTRDDCQGEVREGRVAYGWHPELAERNRRIMKALALARAAVHLGGVD